MRSKRPWTPVRVRLVFPLVVAVLLLPAGAGVSALGRTVLSASPSSVPSLAGSPPPASVHAGPRGGAPPPTDVGRVFTTDPRAANNQFLFATMGVPPDQLVPGENWTILVTEPVNSTMTIGVGVFGFENGSSPEWVPEYFVWNDHGRPANTSVQVPQDSFSQGHQVDLYVTEDHGPWWSFWAGGSLVSGPEGNGTVDLGTSHAAGYSATAPLVEWPSLLVEGNTTAMPFQLELSSVLLYNASENPPDAVNATWIPQNALWWQSNPGFQVAGEDQIGEAVPNAGTMWKLWMGEGEPAAPSNGTWLWGLGGPAVQPYANVTVQGAFAANSGFAMDLDLNASDFGPAASSYLITIWERVAPGLAVGVGDWVNAPGGQNVPFYTKNVSGSSVQYVGDTNAIAGGVPELIKAYPTGRGIWNFTDNGALLQGGEDSFAFGGEYIGPSVAPQGSLTFITIDTWGASAGSETPLAISPSVELNLSGSWTTAPEGWVGPTVVPCSPCAGAPLEGFSQDPILAPGESETSAGLPSLPVGTVLWDGLTFPTANVSWSGVPVSVGSWQNLTAHVWVNGSSGALPSPRVSLDIPAGVVAGPLKTPASGGGLLVNLSFPVSSGATPLTLGATGSSAGYLAGSNSTSTLLEEGNLSVAGHFEGAGIPPGSTGSILLWVNATDGAGPRSDVAWEARSALGATLTDDGLIAGSTAYAFSYTAPEVTGVTGDTVAFIADVPGFHSDTGLVPVEVVPPTMLLAASATPNPVFSGGTIEGTAWVNDTANAPLSGASLAAGFGESGVVPVSSSSPAPGEYTFEVASPLVAVNATLPLIVRASLSGYQTISVTLQVQVVLRLLEVVVSIAPPEQLTYNLAVTVSSGGAGISGALAYLVPSSGTLISQEIGTSPGGWANFTWTAPSSQAGTYSFDLSVSDPGYWSDTVTFTISVAGTTGSSPTPGISLLWLLVAPAVVLLAFLLLWDYGRRKSKREGVAGPRTPKGAPEAGAALPPEASKEESGKELPGDEPEGRTPPPDEVPLPTPAGEVSSPKAPAASDDVSGGPSAPASEP
jgi:hypothetical protein